MSKLLRDNHKMARELVRSYIRTYRTFKLEGKEDYANRTKNQIKTIIKNRWTR